jgi:hypothetical protein
MGGASGIAVLALACAGAAGAQERHHLVVRTERIELGVQGARAGGAAPGWSVHVAPPIEAPFGFDECLPSWNVDVPAGSGFRVDLRVGRGAAEWSPWLRVDAWGALPAAAERLPAAEAFPGGRIDVDHFRSAERWERAQVRLVGFAAGPGLALRRLAVCFTDTAGGRLAARAREAAAPAASAVARLAVPFRSQYDEDPALAERICSPTALAMVLAWRGVDAPTAEVAARVHDPAHDLYGNWPRAIQTAWSYGVPGHLARFAGWEEVERELARGRPLVASVRFEAGELAGSPLARSDGHLLVLTGVAEDGSLFASDPAGRDARAGECRLARDELERAWLAHGGTAYVLLPAADR